MDNVTATLYLLLEQTLTQHSDALNQLGKKNESSVTQSQQILRGAELAFIELCRFILNGLSGHVVAKCC